MKINREDILSEFHKIEDEDPKRARSLIKKLKYKKDHFLLKCIAMTFLDEANFDKKGNWREFPDQGKLRSSEKYINKAYKLNSTCSNVLWILAKVKVAYGQDDEAIKYFEQIATTSPATISNGCCKNDLDISRAQINDSKFQLYRLLKDRDNSKSKKYLKEYKKALKKGVFTLYEPIEKFL